MSRQTGVLRLKGKMGGISFYSSDGQDLARVANGPSKERIEKDPGFKRTRENNTEFGGSAKTAKALRVALSAIIQTMAGSRLVSRLTKLFKQINLKANGKRGERPILLSANKEMLLNLNFDRKLNFSTIFSAPFTSLANADRNEGTVDIAAFNPDSFINSPSGATHFRLVQALGVVSDYTFDKSVGSYGPVDGVLNSLGNVTYSAMESLTPTAPIAINLVTALAGAPTMSTDVSVVQCLGIEFYQEVDGQMYQLSQGNTMKVVNVF